MIKNINLIKLVNCKNNIYDFNTTLTSSNTILIKNCSNINIFVNSKINKIIVENSQFVNLNIVQLINGLEIVKSKVILNPPENYFIPIIELFRSSVYLAGDINIFLNQIVLSENSDIFNIVK